MKKVVSILVAMGLVMVVGTPAFAQNAPGTSMSIRAQAARIGASQAMASDMSSPSGKAVMVSGAALFLGGMGVAIYGFLNNKNGEFPEFGEAEATDSRLGATGLGVAFAGGALMAIGHRMSRVAPDIQVGVNRFSVSKKLSW